MGKFCKSPKENNSSKYNVSFICDECKKKYHLSKLSTSENPICIHCHPPDELEKAIRESLYYNNIRNGYETNHLKSLFKELNTTLIKINQQKQQEC